MLSPGLKVLVADDDVSLRRYIVDYLKGRGIATVYEASGGKEALDIYYEEPIDFIISDWNMPVMTGGDLLDAIRAVNKDNQEVPFIMITVLSEKEVISRALESKVDDFIVKPFRSDVLEQRFEQVLLKKMFHEYVALVFVNIWRQQYELAKEKLLLAYKRRNYEYNLLCGLTICCAELGQMDEAVEYFDKIPVKDKTCLGIYAEGLCLMKQGKFDAVAYFKKCIKQNPSFIKAQVKLAKLYVKMNEADLALKIIEKIDESKINYIEDVVDILAISKDLNNCLQGKCKDIVLKYNHLLNSLTI